MCSDGGRYPLKLDRAKVLDAGIGIRVAVDPEQPKPP